MAALMRAVSTSENSKSWGRIESAGFHTVRSAPFTISRFSSMSFSWPASRASLSCTAQIARIDPTSARCAPSCVGDLRFDALDAFDRIFG